MQKSNYFWLPLILAFVASACGTQAVPPTASGEVQSTAQAVASTLIAETQQAVPSLTPVPTNTAIPLPTATSVPTHPLQIDAMRAQQYPGSDIVIEEVLDPGVNYSRYYVSYLSEGLKIYALMTVPDGEKPSTGWPVIIFNHGFIPPDVYKTTERYIAYVDLIARSGYIVFRSDYRGHDRSEGEPGGAYSNPGYTVDVLNAVASMKRYPDADPNRIGMWGHSMGGYITLRSMVVTQDIKAGVIWAGVVASYPDLLTRWRRGPNAAATPTPNPRSWRFSLMQEFGSPEQNPEFWRSISANSYVNEISGPIQLHHGTLDEDVPLEFSELLYFEMLNANQYVELYKYEGDNHNISNYFSTAMQRTIEFFDRFVKQPGG
ncbi:MAG TPA: alpha/beta fold hydrolase [Anaerolineales bacterium]|nr:alpha/beta fold hydrolase [Anaerolineales bacterium]